MNPNFGKEVASYTFSCYVKADCTPVRDKRKCGIYIEGDMPEFDKDIPEEVRKYLEDHINKEDIAPAAYTEINTAIDGWQYVSMSLPARNWYGKLIEIHFDYECGNLCIDACMLTKDGVDVKTYTSGGKLKTSKTGEKTTTYATNARDQRKKETMPGGAVDKYDYDKTTNDLGKVTHVFNQTSGKKVNTTTYEYDSFGNVIDTLTETSDGKRILTQTEYTGDGRFKKSDIDSRNYKTSYEYNESNGVLNGITDAEGKRTEYSYDKYLNTTAVSLEGNSVRFTYNDYKHDDLKTIHVGNKEDNTQIEYAFKYDAFGNVTEIKNNEDSLIKNTYVKNNGKLKSTAYGDNYTEKYSYNKLEQLSTITRQTGKIRYVYDNKGRLSAIKDDGNDLDYRVVYDEAGRVVASSVKNNTVSANRLYTDIDFYSSFDKAGRQSEFTYNYDGKVYSSYYGYTSDDKLQNVQLPSGGYYKQVYDRLGRIDKEEYTPYKKKATGERHKTATTGKKIESTRGYVTLSRTIDEKKKDYTTRLLSSLETKIGTTTVINDQLTYDSVGRVSSFNNISYSYDELGRLISADEGNNKWTYSYDSIGNIISSSSELGSDNYVYDKNHPDRLVEYNGQKIGKYKGGNPWQYLGYNLTWQNGHELSEIKKVKTNTNKKTNGKSKDNDFSDSSTIDSVKYTYNHDGIRLSKTIGVGKNTKRYEYILNGNTILAQKTGEGENKEQLNFYYSADGKLLEIGYIQGNAKEKHYTVIMNAMGDVAALYTADGTYVGGYEYDPYGAVIAVNHNPDYADADGILEKNPFRYRGYYLDEETGWYYLNSRYYNPKVKRFINVDNPNYIGVGDEFNSYNLFAYCEGNPVNYDDQDGKFANILIGAGVGAITGFLGQVITDVISSTLQGKLQISSWEAYVGSTVGGAVAGTILGATGNVAAANIASGFVTTGVSMSLEKMAGDSDASWSEVAFNSVVDGGISYTLGNIKINGITAGRGNDNSVYRGVLTKLRNGSISRMHKGVLEKGVTSTFISGLYMDAYYGVKELMLDS